MTYTDSAGMVQMFTPQGGGVTPDPTEPSLSASGTYDVNDATYTLSVTQGDRMVSNIRNVLIDGASLRGTPESIDQGTRTISIPSDNFQIGTRYTVSVQVDTDAPETGRTLSHSVLAFAPLRTFLGPDQNPVTDISGYMDNGRLQNREITFQGDPSNPTAFVAYPQVSGRIVEYRIINFPATPSQQAVAVTFNSIPYLVDTFEGVDGNFRLTVEVS